jgi:hypothetical protein
MSRKLYASSIGFLHSERHIPYNRDVCKSFRIMIDIHYRGPTKLVQHSAYRGSLHRSKGATILIACLSQWGGRESITGSYDLYLHTIAATTGMGGRSRTACHPTSGRASSLAYALFCGHNYLISVRVLGGGGEGGG